MGTLKSLSRLFAGKPSRKSEAAAHHAQLDPVALEMAEMLSKLGHELRSPLSAIMGYGEMLTEQVKSGSFQAKDGEKIQKMFAAGGYIERTLTSAITISAIHSGKIRPNMTRFELVDFLEGIEVTGKLLAAKNNSTFVLEISSEEVWVETDQEQLGDIIRELVTNACRFTANGVVTLSAHVRDGMLNVAVVDTGIGITETDLPRIFDRFIKIDPKNKVPFSASSPGLGLALVKEATSMLGGSVFAQSTFGSGSKFTVVVPV